MSDAMFLKSYLRRIIQSFYGIDLLLAWRCLEISHIIFFGSSRNSGSQPRFPNQSFNILHEIIIVLIEKINFKCIDQFKPVRKNSRF
jgi:hypothetical protein